MSALKGRKLRIFRQPSPSFFLAYRTSVFQENRTHLQHSLFGSDQLLPRKYRERLHSTWAHTFRHDVFTCIDERAFAVLYSEETSRPNAAVNVLFGAEILKAGFGWSDRELADHMVFDLQVRHALGLDDMAAEVPELRTLYNFRRRVREYADSSGVNLFEEAFAQITDRQLDTLPLTTEWQRLDSTQILSNLKRLSRLELLIAVLQRVWRSVDAEARSSFEDDVADYVAARPQYVCHEIKAGEIDAHLGRVGTLLRRFCDETESLGEELRSLLDRVLKEHFEIEDGETRPLPEKQLPSGRLQSPHDVEATYRRKGGKRYPGGYVAGVSETCDPENDLQLITDVQVAPNTTDDGVLLERSLANQVARGVDLKQVITDGGYNGEVASKACREHKVDHLATSIRGRKKADDHLGWEDYTWHLDENRDPLMVTCPQGHTAPVRPGKRSGFTVRFKKGTCDGCPLFENGCRVERRSRGPSFYVEERMIEIAVMRQRTGTAEKSMRAPVEATIRSVKHRFAGGKLPVRGLVRATMMLCASALMVNARRIHRYRLEKGLLSPFDLRNWLTALVQAIVVRLLANDRRRTFEPAQRNAMAFK